MSGRPRSAGAEDGLPLLLPVELRPQRERHRAHDQCVLRSAEARRGLAGSGPRPDVEGRRRFQRHRPVPHRSRRTGAPSSPSAPSGPGSSSASSTRKPASSSATDAPRIALASRHGGAIEAASILEHDGRFYLFVSFDQCCKGVASTYNIRVGRADRIEGPYRDKDGKAMLDGGGIARPRHDRPLHRPGRAGGGEDLQRRYAGLPLL